MKISELDKAECTPCPHLQHNGEGRCSIYDERPGECRSFSCGWLHGAFSQLDRPGSSGIILASTFNWCGDGAVVDTGRKNLDGEPVMKPDNIPIATVMEAWDGAAEQHTGAEMLEALGHQCLVVIMYPDGQRVLRSAREDWIKRARDFAVAIIERQAAAEEKAEE